MSSTLLRDLISPPWFNRATPMSSGVERLLAACPVTDLEQLLPALATCWGETWELGELRLKIELGPLAESGYRTFVVWAPGQAASFTREIQSDASGILHAFKVPEGAIPMEFGGRVWGRIWGDPLENLWAAPADWRMVSAWLIAQGSDFTRRLRDLKLEAMAEFAAGAGHEINNPLATIIGRSRQLLSGETDPERRRLLETIGAQAYRARDMIGDTMLFARPPQPMVETLDLLAEVTAVTEKFADEFHRRGTSLFCGPREKDHSPRSGTESPAAPLLIRADRTQLAIVISELVRNSLHAVDEGRGIIRVSWNRTLGDEPPCVILTFTDNGRRLTDEQAVHLFDPFYSGRQAGRGLGFGLSKAWRIVQQHGGSLDVHARDEGGLSFVLRWPCEPERG